MRFLSAAMLVGCFLLELQIGVAQEWTRFRGPNGSGISNAKTIPIEWTKEDYNWVAELPGAGVSSPVVWGKKLFVTSATARERYLLCINTEDGSLLWKQAFPLEKNRTHANNSLASNTPAVDSEYVYVLFQAKQSSPLAAFTHNGIEQWRVDLGPYNHGQGGAVSPIVYEDKVIISNDGKGNSFLLAVNRQTGEELWRIEREGKRACYSTPCLFEPKDRDPEIIFTHSYEGMIGVDPGTGKQNWEITPFGTFSQRAIGSPLIYGDLVIGSSGFTTAEKNVVAVRTTKTSQGVSAEEVYRVSQFVPHVPTPIIYNDLMFFVTDTGIAACVSAKSGELVWKARLGGTFFGSPVCVDGKIYCIDRDGQVSIFAAANEFKLLGKQKLDQPSRSTPAVSDGRIYFRTESHLFSLGGKT